MKTAFAVVLLAYASIVTGGVGASPLSDLQTLQISQLEFGSFKLEVALTGIKDWPFPIAGASVLTRVEPDEIEIVIALTKLRGAPFRAACEETIGRVREFLYVNADGGAPMGRSYLNLYFHGAWRGPQREAALRNIDAATKVRVDVVGQGSCEAPLIKGRITYSPIAHE